jgi:HlyD family secretion protein
VVGPIGASDGVLIKPGQPAVAHFDAIPGLTLNGTVQRVSTVAVQATGFTDYFVTVGLTQGDPRLRSGQTAAAEVVVGRLDNVLVVPNSAVSDQDGKSWVTVDGPDGAARRVAFQAGVVGDDTTQVLGGLTEGQQVELAAG